MVGYGYCFCFRFNSKLPSTRTGGRKCDPAVGLGDGGAAQRGGAYTAAIACIGLDLVVNCIGAGIGALGHRRAPAAAVLRRKVERSAVLGGEIERLAVREIRGSDVASQAVSCKFFVSSLC